MVPATPSFSNATIFAISSSCPRIGIHSPGCSIYGRSHNALQKRYILPQSKPFKLFQKYRSGYGFDCSSRIQIVASVGTNVATDEPNPAISDGGAETSEPLSASNGPSETPSSGPRVTSNAQSKRPKSTRKSDMPPVKKEELVPGASFVGKVRSIQPFGAFVDIGAFTDGLVHVSNLSNEFVKDVGSVVSVGQEVTVQILEANMETRRISLTMRDNDDTSKSQQGKDTTPDTNEDKPKTPRKNAPRFNKKREELQKSKKFVKGQVLDGTVKNLARSGAFISLPDGEEGFLPSSEESEGFTVLGSSSLQVGQEVNVRVLRVTRGQVTLTMKKEDDLVELNMKLNQGVVHTATNPFELAFRKDTEIAAFLEEREKVRKSSEPLSSPEAPKERRNVVPDSPAASAIATEDETFLSEGEGDDSSKTLILNEDVSPVDSVVSDASVATDENELDTESKPADKDEPASPVSQEHGSAERTALSESLQVDGEKDDSAIASIVEDEASAGHDISAEAEPPVTQENLSAAPDESLQVFQAKDDSAIVLTPEDKSSTGSDLLAETVSAADSSVEDELNETDSVDDSTGHSDDKPSSSDNAPDVTAKDSADDPTPILNEVTPASEDAISTISLESAADTRESSTKASISPALVKQLREETGAGMMDCKKALTEAGGDIVKAQEILRQKGLASADNRASRTTAEGRIGSYIHDNRIGVLIEVNCETDFVSRGDMFRELVDDLAMQIAACPQVQYLAPEDIPEESITKERDIELQKEDILAKPEQIRSKIVDGRIRKRLEELALLEQPYIKNDKLAVKDLVRQTIATVGENIKVKRFVRYNLGEGLEKRSQDFAAEVAEQTVARQAPAVQKEKSAETNESAEKSPAVAVSAALVKQLREETGAGMMDCKRALTETGGNLEKAQEYLRKKGLSSADKKSSRLAAEGCISSYIHDSRIGVLIEVNSETDFVGRNEKFRELVDDLAMQVAACPQVDFVSMEDIPQGIVSKEKEIEMQREDLKSKPENIREKIVEGRVAKRLGELALSEQPFIKDDSMLVKDLVKQTVAALGENIKIRRFARFTLGESAD